MTCARCCRRRNSQDARHANAWQGCWRDTRACQVNDAVVINHLVGKINWVRFDRQLAFDESRQLHLPQQRRSADRDLRRLPGGSAGFGGRDLGLAGLQHLRRTLRASRVLRQYAERRQTCQTSAVTTFAHCGEQFRPAARGDDRSSRGRSSDLSRCRGSTGRVVALPASSPAGRHSDLDRKLFFLRVYDACNYSRFDLSCARRSRRRGCLSSI